GCEHQFTTASKSCSETQEATEQDFEAVVNWCSHPSVVAVGESGLDYYWDRSFDDRQKRFFRTHSRLAIEADLPLVIHNRDAAEDILAILEEEYVRAEVPEKMRGILHCYVDPPDVAERAWNLGFYLGVGGIMTFSNSEVDEYVKEVP
ncbi:TatD family deoxyribonuclease, partial [Halorubrum sp. GN11_10-6_MGM]